MVAKANKANTSRLRIIAGQWKGRKLTFPTRPSVRPTPDRIRETVFNWLMHDLKGARVLDLFAGSGALGFEALSRGAQEAVLCDRDPIITQHLAQTAKVLGCEDRICLVTAAMPKQDPPFSGPFDIIFLDPPFRKVWLPRCYQWLQESECLQDGSLIYVECERTAKADMLTLPEGWTCQHEKTAGEVVYGLLEVVNNRK